MTKFSNLIANLVLAKCECRLKESIVPRADGSAEVQFPHVSVLLRCIDLKSNIQILVTDLKNRSPPNILMVIPEIWKWW